jgi:DNA-binding CsgD family transcriptional regulator
LKDVFVGRHAELAFLRDRLQGARRGVSGIVFVEGDSGIGKTALLRRFLEGAENTHVLSAAGEELESGLPFGIVEQLFHGFGLLDGRCPVALGTEPTRADVLAVGAKLVEAVGKLSRLGVVTVAVDDAQWADVGSLQSLTFLIRRLREHRVLAIIVTRDTAADLPPSLYRLLTAGGGERLRLNGLSAPEIRALAAEMGVGTLSNREAMRLHAHTRGSPLHARALFEEVSPEALRGTELPLPAPRSFAMLVLSRLARCSPETERLVVAMAVLGRRASIELAAQLADIEQPLVSLEQAIAARLLEEQRTAIERLIGFPHPLVQAAVYRDIGPARRSMLHSRAAEFLHGEADTLSHRIAATAGTDACLAQEVAANARHQAASGARAIAASRLAAAARLAPSQTEREQYLLEAVECMLIDGSTTEAIALEGTLITFRAAAYQRYVLGRLAAVSGAITRAEVLLTDAWQQRDPTQPALAARIAAQFANLHQIRGNAALSAEWARRALATEPTTARAEHVTDLLLLTLGMSGRFSEGLRLCASLPERGHHLHAEPLDGLVGRGVLRLWSSDTARARYDLDAVATTQERLGRCPMPYRVIALAALADAEYRLGDWDAAQVHAELAVTTAEDAGRHCLLALPHAVAAFTMAGRGDWQRAQAHLEAATHGARAVGGPIGIQYAARARAVLSSARNDPAGVVAAVEPVLRLDSDGDIITPGTLPLRELYVGALIDLGQLDEAELWLVRLEAHAAQRGEPELLTVAHRLRGDLEAAGHPAEAEAAYQDGLHQAQNMENSFSRAQLEVAYGRFLRRNGRRAAAAIQLEAASRRLSQLGARPYLERCSRELEACVTGRAKRQPARSCRLTPQERAVARLVAAGHSNRQAAGELYLSVKTVEFHLTNIFTKLGVRSRSQLVLALSDTRDPPEVADS